MTANPRSREFTWTDPTALAKAGAGMSGIELFSAVLNGHLPPPPIMQLVGLNLVEVERGRTVFSLEPAEWMFNATGSVHGGIAATLLDSCLGCAVHTGLPAGVGYTTSDLHVRYLRPMTADTGRVLAIGEVIRAGRRQAVAEGRLVTEADDRLIAHGTTGCIVLGG